MLVDDHIANFNKNRACNYHPSDYIFVDESMSRFYGIGGHWINYALPQYISIYINTGNCYEIHNAVDGVSVIIMWLNLVKTYSEEYLHSPEEDDGFLHGTKLMLNILQPWVNKQRRFVSTESYFALVQACYDMDKRGFRFVGVAKTETRGLGMTKTFEIELARRGLWKVYFALDNKKKLDKFDFIWVDRDRMYFISNTSYFKSGMPYERDRLRQLDYSPNADPVCVEFEINQPRVAERYYSINSKVDESNCTGQDDFQLERKIQTKDCSIRVNTSILGTNDVDTYYLGKDCKCWDEKKPAEFYYNLAKEIIDNRWTERRTQINQAGQPMEHPGYIRNVVPHCTPTKKEEKKDTRWIERYQVTGTIHMQSM